MTAETNELTEYDLELMEQKYGRRDECDDCGAEMWGFKRPASTKLQCAACFIKSEGDAICESCGGRRYEGNNRTVGCRECRATGRAIESSPRQLLSLTW